MSGHVPSCTDEALDAETCMSADCTIYIVGVPRSSIYIPRSSIYIHE